MQFEVLNSLIDIYLWLQNWCFPPLWTEFTNNKLFGCVQFNLLKDELCFSSLTIFIITLKASVTSSWRFNIPTILSRILLQPSFPWVKKCCPPLFCPLPQGSGPSWRTSNIWHWSEGSPFAHHHTKPKLPFQKDSKFFLSFHPIIPWCLEWHKISECDEVL